MSLEQSYEVVPFESYPTPERGVWRIETIGRLFGRSPVEVRRARVLDIGCGAGTLLLTMAAELPDATFVGIDKSLTHLARAEEAKAKLRLFNVSFECRDISAFEPGDEQFDYIFAYGLYSWIERPLQERLLELIEKLLSPDGLAAVSFNPWPGFYGRELLRGLFEQCVGPTAKDLGIVRTARECFGHVFKSILDTASPHADVLRDEISRATQQNDAHLFYTLLSPTVSSISVTHLVEALARYDLRYIADARPRNWRAVRKIREEVQLSSEMRRMQSLVTDEVALEGLLDLITPASFRTAIIEKTSKKLPAAFDLRQIESLRISSHLVERESLAPTKLRRSSFFNQSGEEIPVTSECADAALRMIEAAWPQNVAVSKLLANQSAPSRDELLEQICTWYLDELVELETSPIRAAATVQEKPVVYPLARIQALAQEWVTTGRRGYITLDQFGAAIISLCDGSRDCAAIARDLIAMKGGTLPTEITQDQVVEAVKEVLENFKEGALLLESHPDVGLA